MDQPNKGDQQMKKISLSMVLLVVISSPCFATYYQYNPDHCLSFGVNLSGVNSNGTAKLTSGGLSAEQDTTGASLAFLVDTRIPVSEALSLNAGIGFGGSSYKTTETMLLDASSLDQGSFLFNVGLRIYVH
jgi:hypothetical protein